MPPISKGHVDLIYETNRKLCIMDILSSHKTMLYEELFIMLQLLTLFLQRVLIVKNKVRELW